MSAVALMLSGWTVEATIGWPDWLCRKIGHPVTWFGFLVRRFDKLLNRPERPHPVRYVMGAITTGLLVSLAAGLGYLIARLLPQTIAGDIVEAVIVSSLIASRSLYQHVAAVAPPLLQGDMQDARTAISRIVGRDPSQLDEAGITRAALESLSENASDGVIAPLFWGALFGLPGIAAYKAVNTLDSMIGHRNVRHEAFGGFAARLDDAANFIPARLTAFFIALVSGNARAFRVMLRDAKRHRSPNAGWPESAMAGALNVRLSGPRIYGDSTSSEPWLNGEAPDPSPADLRSGLQLYVRAMACAGLLLGLTVLMLVLA